MKYRLTFTANYNGIRAAIIPQVAVDITGAVGKVIIIISTWTIDMTHSKYIVMVIWIRATGCETNISTGHWICTIIIIL